MELALQNKNITSVGHSEKSILIGIDHHIHTIPMSKAWALVKSLYPDNTDAQIAFRIGQSSLYQCKHCR